MKTKLMALEALNSLLANMEPEELKFIPATEANAKEAIATLESDIAKPVEPFAWCIDSKNSADWCFSATESGVKLNAELMHEDCEKTEPFPVFTTPQEPAAAAIPAGWKLVPIEPDMRMCVAGKDAELFSPSCRSALVVYRAMLAAAPGGAA